MIDRGNCLSNLLGWDGFVCKIITVAVLKVFFVTFQDS